MKKYLVIAILISACGGSGEKTVTTKDSTGVPSASISKNPVIGTPIKHGNLEIAEKSYPHLVVWDQAVRISDTLGQGWRLPSLDELRDLYKNKDAIGGFTNDLYWSATETDAFNVSTINFYNGEEGKFNKVYSSQVRFVRSK
ncbi:MAG: hypothetical protein ACO25B_10255 [Chitinophagaceae bacterium]